MPYKSRIIDPLPEWILAVSDGDDCLYEVLTEALAAGQKALEAILQRGDEAPRTCTGEMRSAETILEAIRDGRVSRSAIAQKAAQAVRKFDTARQCARFLEKDDSPTFAHEAPEHRARILTAREDSPLVRRVR